MADSNQMGVDEWHSVWVENSKLGFTAQERSDRFRLEALTEIALRVFGILMIAGAFLLYILMTNQASLTIGIRDGMMVAALAATGLMIFAYGTRGFRRQVRFDRREGTLSVTKININEQARVERSIPVDRIESVYVKRPSKHAATAQLYLRIKGVLAPICALSGDSTEIEALHRGLCSEFSQVA